jgi:hypothetical protein
MEHLPPNVSPNALPTAEEAREILNRLDWREYSTPATTKEDILAARPTAVPYMVDESVQYIDMARGGSGGIYEALRSRNFNYWLEKREKGPSYTPPYVTPMLVKPEHTVEVAALLETADLPKVTGLRGPLPSYLARPEPTPPDIDQAHAIYCPEGFAVVPIYHEAPGTRGFDRRDELVVFTSLKEDETHPDF